MIKFAGNVTANAINTLTQSSQFPADELALTNMFLLAPDCAVIFTGNFGTIAGSIIADPPAWRCSR